MTTIIPNEQELAPIPHGSPHVTHDSPLTTLVPQPHTPEFPVFAIRFQALMHKHNLNLDGLNDIWAGRSSRERLFAIYKGQRIPIRGDLRDLLRVLGEPLDYFKDTLPAGRIGRLGRNPEDPDPSATWYPFAVLLGNLMLSRGLTRKDLNIAVFGSNKGRLSRICLGLARPGSKLLRRLETGLGVEKGYFDEALKQRGAVGQDIPSSALR